MLTPAVARVKVELRPQQRPHPLGDLGGFDGVFAQRDVGPFGVDDPDQAGMAAGQCLDPGAVALAYHGVGTSNARSRIAAPFGPASRSTFFKPNVSGIMHQREPAMDLNEETIDATLDSNGQLQLARQSQLPPGPVQVTIRVAPAFGAQRGLADVIREIAAEQRIRGFPGRSPADLRSEDDAQQGDDGERDQELDAARRGTSSGRP